METIDKNTGELTPRPIEKVAAKIHAVMAKVDSVAKAGRNDFHNYDYVREQDIVAIVRDAMVEVGLIIMPDVVEKTTTHAGTTQKGADQWLNDITVMYTLIDPESGQWIAARMCGSSIDSGDKGIYKAITGANKYMLMKTFQIGTDDDPEKGSPERKPPAKQYGNAVGAATEKQVKLIYALKKYASGAALKKIEDYLALPEPERDKNKASEIITYLNVEKGKQRGSEAPTGSGQDVDTLERELVERGLVSISQIDQMREAFGEATDIVAMKAPARKKYYEQLVRIKKENPKWNTKW